MRERGRTSATAVAIVAVGLLLLSLLTLMTACSSSPQADDEFPPGNPVLGDNPVLGSEGPGEIPELDSTNYGLLIILAVCLIAAGALLVMVERWARGRSQTGVIDPPT